MTGLKLLAFDQTDSESINNYLKSVTPTSLDLIDSAIDEVDIKLGLSQAWWTGASMYKHFRRFDYVGGFACWEDALEWMSKVGTNKPISEIQYWGHGSPGKVWLNGEVLHSRSFYGARNGDLLKKVRDRLTPDATIWFRTCATFCGTRGHEFAEAFTEQMGVNVAAHTHNIGLFQSGLHTAKPGVKPGWPVTEGVASGTPDKPSKIVWSGMTRPNTIWALRSTIPNGW